MEKWVDLTPGHTISYLPVKHQSFKSSNFPVLAVWFPPKQVNTKSITCFNRESGTIKMVEPYRKKVICRNLSSSGSNLCTNVLWRQPPVIVHIKWINKVISVSLLTLKYFLTNVVHNLVQIPCHTETEVTLHLNAGRMCIHYIDVSWNGKFSVGNFWVTVSFNVKCFIQSFWQQLCNIIDIISQSNEWIFRTIEH